MKLIQVRRLKMLHTYNYIFERISYRKNHSLLCIINTSQAMFKMNKSCLVKHSYTILSKMNEKLYFLFYFDRNENWKTELNVQHNK